MSKPHIIERAFELAPQCFSIEQLARKLDFEGYSAVLDHLTAPSLRAELKAMMKASER